MHIQGHQSAQLTDTQAWALPMETLPDRMTPYHDALVHVAIVVFYTDADDAGVLVLLIVNGRQYCGGNGCHGDGTFVDFRVVVAGWRGGQGVD